MKKERFEIQFVKQSKRAIRIEKERKHQQKQNRKFEYCKDWGLTF